MTIYLLLTWAALTVAGLYVLWRPKFKENRP